MTTKQVLRWRHRPDRDVTGTCFQLPRAARYLRRTLSTDAVPNYGKAFYNHVINRLQFEKKVETTVEHDL